MNNNFKENLRKIRKENNLSQEQLADELGVSRQAISKWESGSAYPEMDKIIALCDKFDLNIDDLLHKDIKEVRGEEESKKKLNNLINDFLEFITNTINMFSKMDLKSKIKCLFEQCIIAFILFTVSLIIYNVLSSLFSSILILLPNIIYTFINGILKSILAIALIIISLIIITHIFKTRYLYYYEKLKKEEKNDIEETENTKSENKISLNNNDKIIIRDSKHSEYSFINIMFKTIIIIIKLFAIWFGLCISFVLVCLFISLVAAFLMYKTGLFFIGLLITILSSSAIGIVILLLILNFVFNRKSDKKKMIWSFISSLIILGVGCGMIFVGATSFDVIESNETTLTKVTREYDMNDKLLMYPHSDYEIEYVETDNSNIKVEYSICKYCEIKDHYKKNHDYTMIMAWSYCNNPTKLVREFFKNANDKKIVSINNTIQKITIYTNQNNIDTLKNNLNHLEEIDKEEERNDYENRINELEQQNLELQQKIYDLQEQLDNQ